MRKLENNLSPIMQKIGSFTVMLALLGAASASAATDATTAITQPTSRTSPLREAAARCFEKPGNWAHLIEGCTVVLGAKGAPDKVRVAALFNRGLGFQRSREAAQALADFSEALSIRPDFARALAARGSIYVGLHKLELGIADLTKAIAIDPKILPAYNNRALAYIGKQDYPKAIADFTKAIELRQGEAKSSAARGSAYMAADDAKAKADSNKVLVLDAQYTTALYNRGLLYKAIGQRDKAKIDFAAVLALFPDHALAKKELDELVKAGS